jgi:HAD superfamily hydrolase (TIGR01509 family)
VSPPRAALLDVDGTLADSNDAHAAAWVDVGREFGFEVEFAHVRRLIGMGGDKVLPRLSGIDEGSPQGQLVAQRRGEIFRARYLPRVRGFPGARGLLERLRRSGMTLAVATSASPEDLRLLLEAAGVADLVDTAASADDADRSKPDPDIVQAALARSGARPDEAVMLGDTPYDVEAARRAGVRCVALRCGGWGDAELAGADAIYEDPAELLARFGESPFA